MTENIFIYFMPLIVFTGFISGHILFPIIYYFTEINFFFGLLFVIIYTLLLIGVLFVVSKKIEKRTLKNEKNNQDRS